LEWLDAQRDCRRASDLVSISLVGMSGSKSFIASALTALTLTGAGLGCLLYSIDYLDMKRLGEVPFFWHGLSIILGFVAAAPLIGAGILAPFRRPRLGAYIGFFGEIAAGLTWFIHVNGWWQMWDKTDFRVIFGLTIAVLIVTAWRVSRSVWPRRA